MTYRPAAHAMPTLLQCSSTGLQASPAKVQFVGSMSPPMPMQQLRSPPQQQLPVSTVVQPSCPLPLAPGVAGGKVGGFEEQELQIGAGAFDPTQSAVKSTLLAKLGVGPTSVIERMQGRSGGRNEGVWILYDGSQSLVLKLVNCQRRHQQIPTEAEKLVKLAREHPAIVNDPALAFPSKIFHCLGPAGETRYNLIVMRKVPGQTLSEVIGTKWQANQVSSVMQILDEFGRFLADFHMRYANKQHGDLQPSNVLYEEAGRKFVLIDVADLGGRVLPSERDVERFIAGLGLVSQTCGQQLYVEGKQHFEAGYGRNRPCTHA